jgi:ABC-type multidrug transport system fused ATPase/permease subunit
MARHRRYRNSDDTDDLPKVRISGRSLREAARLGRYLLPYKITFLLALAGLATSSLLALALPAVAGRLVNGALTPASADLPWYRGTDATALMLVGVLALQASFAFLQAVCFGRVSERSLADLRRDTYAHMIRLPMVLHARRRVGELASRIAADLALIQDTLLMTLPHFLRQLTILVGGIALIAWSSGRLTLVMLGMFPALIAVAVLFGRVIRKNAKLAQDRLADSAVVVEETLQGIATVKAFANESYEEDRYRGSLDAYLVPALRGVWYRGGFVAFILFALFGAVALVLWYGTRLVQTGDLTVGGLASFMLYTLFVAGAMGSFAEIYSQIQRTLGAAQRVLELLEEKPEVVGSAPAAHPRLRGHVAFEDVAFRYPSRKESEVLRNVTLTLRAGERVALVGPSGAGKSTLVSLLLRFYDPDQGCILLDGQDVREYDLLALRSQMAVVPQDVLLFGGNIGENIAYGRPGASEEEIIAAAREANAHDFITSFPDGYKTRVGERGVQLSGGQRQRVAIARAILRDPAVLILDEATSSLDSESEALVLQALDRLMEGRTSLVIAHRLSTVRRADRIFVLKEGTIVESGTHTELMARDAGIYRNLSLLQLDPSDGSIAVG